MTTILETVTTDRGRYHIRPYAADDLPAVATAWSAAFGKPLDETLWRWKYHDAPGGHRVLLCEHDNGEIAAFYGGSSYPARWQGRSLLATQMTDVFSHPGHRRQLAGRGGLYVRTSLHFFERYGSPQESAVLYGLPSERPFRLGRKLMGYQALPGGASYLVADTADLARRGPRLFTGSLSPVDAGDLGGLDALDANPPAAMRDRLQARRDARFFGWRFLDHPRNHYRCRRYRPWLGPHWRGYVVVLDQDDSAILVDLLLPDEPRLDADLFARLGAELNADGIGQLRTWLPEPSLEARRLAAIGFEPATEPLGIIPTARCFDPAMDWPGPARDFYYTMADSDLY